MSGLYRSPRDPAVRTASPSVDDSFHWRSWLGVGVALFLPYGVLNALVGALLPVLRRRSVGPGGSDILLLNPPQDTALFGRPPAEILRTVNRRPILPIGHRQ